MTAEQMATRSAIWKSRDALRVEVESSAASESGGAPRKQALEPEARLQKLAIKKPRKGVALTAAEVRRIRSTSKWRLSRSSGQCGRGRVRAAREAR